MPQVGPGSLYADVHVDYGIVGRLAGLFYKPPAAWITVDDSKGRHVTHRFVPAVASDGLFLSAFMDNTTDLGNVIEGHFDNPITGFTITTDRPAMAYAPPTIKIEYRLRRPSR